MPSGQDSYQRFLDGQLLFSGNVFQDVVTDGDLCAGQSAAASDIFKITMGSGWPSAADSTNALNESLAAWQASFAANNNMVAETGITYDFDETGGLNPVPQFNAGGATPASDSWFSSVSYKGAFDPSANNWVMGWTALDAYGFFNTPSLPCGETIVVSDNGSGVGTTTWRACNTYVLDGFIFVNDGQCLTIEAGTVIKGMPGTGADASALIVARGGKIFAEGTADAPIIFTFEADPLDGSVPYTTNGEWGGVIVLGNASLNSSPGETQIEGIPETEPRGIYGGSNDDDNSGILKYVSIRHGGTDIGAGNEINGLTLGGVGRNTTIEYIEVVSNPDDGIEFFGGTARVRNIAIAYPGDDAFDYDEGWRGYGQFWFAIQDANDPATADRGGEHDGGTDPEDGIPYATPVIANATYMGQGVTAGNRAVTFRDNAGGQYHNSIFYNWGRGIDVENLPSGEDSYARFEAGDLVLAGNCFYNVVNEGSATASDLFKISMIAGWASAADSTAALTASSAAFQASFAANGNESNNPGISYDFSGDLPLIMPTPTNAVTATSTVNDAWFQTVAYKGAFAPNSDCNGLTWLSGWSYLDLNGHLGCITSVEENFNANEVAQLLVYPNPTSGNIKFTNNQTLSNATIEVYSLTGALVYSQQGVQMAAGATNEIELNGLTEGVYSIKVVNGQEVSFAKFIVKH
ncbi:MAG: T9SS type A sorting domain-containing protein [Flavobacteriales bacterium]